MPQEAPFAEAAQSRQPVYYGEDNPTLYTDLPEQQQNAVVALTYMGANFCTGTQISPHVVLTAAHCLDEMLPHQIRVFFGPDVTAPLQAIDVAAIKAKENWAADGEDIALLALSRTPSVSRPIPFRWGDLDTMVGQPAQCVGYGTTHDNEDNAQRHWTTTLVELAERYIIIDGQGVSGVAPGDSGGPLLFQFEDAIQVSGVASTAADGWVTYASYCAAWQHTDWIMEFIERYDDSSCLQSCLGVECGESQGCSCGDCPRGFDCSADNTCQPIAAGSGGACYNPTDNYTGCEDSAQCSPQQVCFAPAQGEPGLCLDSCGAETCSDSDPYSYCHNINVLADIWLSVCQQSSKAPCDDASFSTCTTEDQMEGICMQLSGDETPLCYPLCEVVPTCPQPGGCLPLDCPDAGVCSISQPDPAPCRNCGTNTKPGKKQSDCSALPAATPWVLLPFFLRRFR